MSGGTFTATAYGPPWTGMQGTGITAARINLKDGKPAYIVAVDPKVIPLGTKLHITPNPFGDSSIVFTAADTGGAIKGSRIDFYDWRGRRFQNAWGLRPVKVTIAKAGAAIKRPSGKALIAHVPDTSVPSSSSSTAGSTLFDEGQKSKATYALVWVVMVAGGALLFATGANRTLGGAPVRAAKAAGKVGARAAVAA